MHLKFLTLGLAACVTNAIPVANTADNISTSSITNRSLVSGGGPTIRWSFDNVAKAKNDDPQHELENLINALLQDFGLPERIPDSAKFVGSRGFIKIKIPSTIDVSRLTCPCLGTLVFDENHHRGSLKIIEDRPHWEHPATDKILVPFVVG
ncbi:hypothetical protein F5051DRAFT_126689 [Lentinula edodes]|nr:hypothetical protein F5051DRAFT_126689 [Lentinula edodes]